MDKKIDEIECSINKPENRNKILNFEIRQLLGKTEKSEQKSFKGILKKLKLIKP